MPLIEKRKKGEATFHLATDALEAMFCYIEGCQWNVYHMQQLMDVLIVSVSGKSYYPSTIAGVWGLVVEASKKCNNQDQDDINALKEVFDHCKKLMFKYSLWPDVGINIEQAQSNVETINSQIAAQLAIADKLHPTKAQTYQRISQ